MHGMEGGLFNIIFGTTYKINFNFKLFYYIQNRGFNKDLYFHPRMDIVSISDEESLLEEENT